MDAIIAFRCSALPDLAVLTKTQSPPFDFTQLITLTYALVNQSPTTHTSRPLHNQTYTTQQPCLCIAPHRRHPQPCSVSPLAVPLVLNALNVCVLPSAHHNLLFTSHRDEACKLPPLTAPTHWTPCRHRETLAFPRLLSPDYLRSPLHPRASQSHLLQTTNRSVFPRRKLKSPRP